jgi:hypothetical protein
MNSDPRTRRGRFGFRSYTSLAAAVALVCVGLFLFRRNYPYGVDHCCDKLVGQALVSYAAAHDGRFPTGGETPEASLSLLYPEYIDAGDLRGKTYPEGPARELLESGRPLTPETCGWHYVDGLTLQEDSRLNSRIAIVWDKVGLGHNSELLPAGGHSVVFMDGSTGVICEKDWPRFVNEQEKAWAAIRSGGKPDPPWVPDRPF